MSWSNAISIRIISVIFLLLTGCSNGGDDGTAVVEEPVVLSGEIRIVVSANGATGDQAFDAAVSTFNQSHPDLNVVVSKLENYNDEFNTLIGSTTADIVSWKAGNAMESFATAGMFEDISDLWLEKELGAVFAGATPAMTRNNKMWGIPFTASSWGVYYRKDIFQNLGIEEPVTWPDFQAAAETLKANNIAPLTIGTKFLWPAGAVFDHLNLRINGFTVHNDLTAGRIQYTDERIRDVFRTWGEMVGNGYFIDNHPDLSWLDAITPFVQGDAGMYLMGNFLVSQLRDAGLSDDQFDFFAFPQISAAVPQSEEAPMEALFIPANATNKAAARAFVEYMAQTDTQTIFNEAYGRLPVNINSVAGDDAYLQKGFSQISSATALSQFFDRDAPADMAEPAFNGFREFMLNPARVEAILLNLDAVQATAYP